MTTKQTPRQKTLTRRQAVTALVAVCLALSPSLPAAAGAQPKDSKARRGAATAAQVREARARFKHGAALFKDQDYRAASLEFQRSYELRPHPLTQFNLASCHSHLGRYLEAINHYRRSLEARPRLSAPMRRLARREIKRLRGLLGVIRVRSNVRDAEVWIDGKARGEGSYVAVRLPGGQHRVEVRAPGRVTELRQVDLAAREVQNLRIELARGARLLVDASPARAQLTLSGRQVGRTPHAQHVPAGTHALRVAHPGYVPWTGSVTASERGTIAVDVTLRTPDHGLSQPWFWTAAAVTLGLGVGALLVGLRGLDRQAEFDELAARIQAREFATAGELAAWQARGRELAAEVDKHETACNVLIGLTAAGAVGTAVLFWFTRFGDVASEADIRVGVAPGGGAYATYGGVF